MALYVKEAIPLMKKLQKEGHTYLGISKIIGIDPKTISKYLKK